ncbi:hydrogenase iron-sulfur subunit, partial [Chloroflexota bacterium]
RSADKCVDCLTCVRVCPYGVPYITADGSVEIATDQCQACGLCFSECPARAIGFRTPVFDEVIQGLDTALSGLRSKGSSPALIGFTCTYGDHAKSSFVELLSKGLPDNVAVVRIPCVAKIGAAHIIKAFELGAEGVFITDCPREGCQYQDVVKWVRRRVEAVKALLGGLGLGGERLEIYGLSSSETGEFMQVVAGFAEQMKGLTSIK